MTYAQEFVERILNRIDGLHGIFVTDKEGGPILQAVSKDISLDPLKAASLASTFSITSEQAGKLFFGTNQKTIAFYDNCVIVHVSMTPLVVSFVGDTSVNVGLILALEREICSALESVREIKSEAW
eukprot:c18338_g1_i4.p1 GENE.c18338_g1_i4~~c18338_g1_i4.p1  ORF type:complete len:126 (+),score=51.21 c18338_g1_i4:71-448(+)